MARMDSRSANVSAVVVGGELNGLGVVRSLARHGIRTLTVDMESRAAFWSRHTQGRLIRNLEGREFIDDMIEIGRKMSEPPVLMLTAEPAVHAVSENIDEISKWFRVRIPTDEKVKLLSSKASFHVFAQVNDFEVPRTVVLESVSDMALLGMLQFPCVMKPDDKRSALSGKKERALRIETLKEAREQAAVMLETPGGIVVQEWIEGADSNIYFTLFYRGADGRPIATFTGRKLSCYPRNVGSTAVCVAAPDAHEVLEPMTLAFAECASMAGMGSMEYKWDDHRRKFVMIEPTVGRTDWQEEIATLCGTNIPVAAYQHELGLPVTAATANRMNVAWRASIADKPPPHLLTGITEIVDGYFRTEDPLPALRQYCMGNPLHRLRQMMQKDVLTNRPENLLSGRN
ncbi:carboxylate--amine ligase [Paraburkholderia atlantica]|uniref:carboxylate--amine ligase n=1 Tax=Paraburkholderia atlantica TaxID=2654982 RepID=UPI00160E99BA|nr:carboxylate--amine ligase [Paraburkholderia atlantica]MBB5505174.1 putative ATP-grasp superfamily ATP-dependent carboligase [Paraburkholderia atlantica]